MEVRQSKQTFFKDWMEFKRDPFLHSSLFQALDNVPAVRAAALIEIRDADFAHTERKAGIAKRGDHSVTRVLAARG